MKRGHPFQPGNQYGRGRPRGSHNKKRLPAQELLSSHADAILRKAMVMALQGDKQLMRALLSYILPRTTESPVKTGPLPAGTAEELDQSFEVILKKVCTGRLKVTEAQNLAALLEGRRRVIDTREHEARLAAAEGLLKPRKNGTG